jgi:hypothetical protein
MCRNIQPLYNLTPPATDAEIEAAARQFVRKISGFGKPSQANQAALERAVQAISQEIHTLLADLVTSAPPRDRVALAEKAQAQSRRRFGPRAA